MLSECNNYIIIYMLPYFCHFLLIILKCSRCFGRNHFNGKDFKEKLCDKLSIFYNKLNANDSYETCFVVVLNKPLSKQ